MTAHAAMENTFFEDFSVQKMLTIIFTSDTACLEQIDGQAVYREKNCPKPSSEHPRPRLIFSAPYLDPKTNLVFIYKHWFSGSFGANGSLLVYELQSDGTLVYKYGIGLFRS